MKRTYQLMTRMTGVSDDMVTEMNDLKGSIHQIRDHVADFDDFFRPVRNYFYWEKHCENIPGCFAFRSVFDSMDGISTMSDSMDRTVLKMNELNGLMPEMSARSSRR